MKGFYYQRNHKERKCVYTHTHTHNNKNIYNIINNLLLVTCVPICMYSLYTLLDTHLGVLNE